VPQAEHESAAGDRSLDLVAVHGELVAMAVRIKSVRFE
jgi:hypothetical protein